MARKLRVEYPGAVYRVMNRGDRREPIFRDDQMMERLGAEHYGGERPETATEHAEGIVAPELRRWRWSDRELEHRAKGDPEKVAIAMRLRRESQVTARWIAGRLRMGAPGHPNHLLYRGRRGAGKT